MAFWKPIDIASYVLVLPNICWQNTNTGIILYIMLTIIPA